MNRVSNFDESLSDSTLLETEQVRGLNFYLTLECRCIQTKDEQNEKKIDI